MSDKNMSRGSSVTEEPIAVLPAGPEPEQSGATDESALAASPEIPAADTSAAPVPPAPPVPLTGATAGGVEVDCPGCGLQVVGDSPRATASWFCPNCDYPLFWVTEPTPPPTPQPRARKRLPGTGGTVLVGSEPCWHCGEMNEPGVHECLRCAARLPKPAAPKVVVTEELRIPVPIPRPVALPTWPFIVAVACGTAAVTIAAVIRVIAAVGG